MTTRRNFFRLVAGAAAMVAVPGLAPARDVPRIFCDGVSDDAPGLSALIRGELVNLRLPEMAEHIGWRGQRLFLEGNFTLKTPVRISGLSSVDLSGGRYDVDGPQVPFEFSHCGTIRLRQMQINKLGNDPFRLYPAQSERHMYRLRVVGSCKA